MRIIVSDTSCLIDLRKASLLAAFMKLPYEIIIPDTLFEEELLKFSEAEKNILREGGLTVTELSGEGVLRAQEISPYFRRYPYMTASPLLSPNETRVAFCSRATTALEKSQTGMQLKFTVFCGLLMKLKILIQRLYRSL